MHSESSHGTLTIPDADPVTNVLNNGHQACDGEAPRAVPGHGRGHVHAQGHVVVLCELQVQQLLAPGVSVCAALGVALRPCGEDGFIPQRERKGQQPATIACA